MNKQELFKKLAERPLKVITVECEDLGSVYLKEMNGASRDRFEMSLSDNDLKTTSVRALLVSLHLCDPNGELFEFSDAEREQLAEGISGKTLDKLFDECRKLSGLVEDSEGN